MNNEKKFIEHRPSYVSGFENQTYEVKTFDEVLEIPFVKKFSEQSEFYSYAVSVYTGKNLDDYKLTLMALYDWDDEYNGCREWWVVGYLPGFIMWETKLKNYADLIHSHKPNCWTAKYNGNKHLFGFDRPEESMMKIAKELGWERDDFYGIANHCDCGFTIKQKFRNNNMIPVNYKGKVVGYTGDEGKTIHFDDSEEVKLLLQSLDKNIGISSRGFGKVSEDGSVTERKVKSLDIFDLE